MIGRQQRLYVAACAAATCAVATALVVSACTGRCVSLMFVGDVMLGRGIDRARGSRGDVYPFEHVAAHLREADLTFGNLEGPLTDKASRFPRINGLIGSPDMVPVLRDVGFDVLSLANNHAIDGGRRGLRLTCEQLRAAGIAPVGVGSSLAEAERGVVVTSRGVRIGFVAYSGFPSATFVRDPQRETILQLNRQALKRTIPGLADRCDALVVSYHWGREGDHGVKPAERELAQLAIDLGADLVVGHHAHVRGPIEQYRGGVIAYCLGNLVFDEQSYGGNEGYILNCQVSRAGIESYSTVPVVCVDGQARIDGARAARMAPQ